MANRTANRRQECATSDGPRSEISNLRQVTCSLPAVAITGPRRCCQRILLLLYNCKFTLDCFLSVSQFSELYSNGYINRSSVSSFIRICSNGISTRFTETHRCHSLPTLRPDGRPRWAELKQISTAPKESPCNSQSRFVRIGGPDNALAGRVIHPSSTGKRKVARNNTTWKTSASGPGGCGLARSRTTIIASEHPQGNVVADLGGHLHSDSSSASSGLEVAISAS